ncbi:MAG: hypothetical protein VB099_08875 [Candidatus Limiplasma sp.]|nr:hypothetical protein [Candidatus Limiplasma sp.]
MKPMKRTIAVLTLLALILTLPALAAAAPQNGTVTLAQLREQAAGGWHKTYETKWRDVTIDTQIHLPQVDAMPVSAVAIVPLQPPADAGERGWEIHSFDEGLGIRTNFNFRIDASNPEEVSRELDKLVRRGKLHYYLSAAVYRDFEDGKAYGLGSELTLWDMKRRVRQVLEAVGVEESAYDLSSPSELMAWTYVDKKTGEILRTTFHVDFPGMLHGVPILQEHYMEFNLSMTQDNHWWCGYINPLAETERLAQDTPLVPLEQVMQPLEEQIAAGHIRAVLDMRLGYRLYQDKAESTGDGRLTSTQYAVPMWVVNCIAVKDPNKALEITAKEREGNEDYPEESIQRASKHYKTYVVDARTGHLYETLTDWPYKNVDDEPEYFRQEMLGK